jgi:hypothetical protein
MALFEDAVRFGGLVMAHAAYVASDLEHGALICPFSVIETDGERQVRAYESDSQAESIERGKASFEDYKNTVDLWSLAREGLLSSVGGNEPKQDVLTVSAWKTGLDEPVILHQCFKPKSSGDFRLVGSLTVSIHGMRPPEPAHSALVSIALEGVRQHPQGDFWDQWAESGV